jgi:hypothetical protein
MQARFNYADCPGAGLLWRVRPRRVRLRSRTPGSQLGSVPATTAEIENWYRSSSVTAPLREACVEYQPVADFGKG